MSGCCLHSDCASENLNGGGPFSVLGEKTWFDDGLLQADGWSYKPWSFMRAESSFGRPTPPFQSPFEVKEWGLCGVIRGYG